MNKPRKPTANIQAFEREIKRLEKAVKLAQKKGIVFFASPVPEKPARVTKKQLDLIKAITPADIRAKGYIKTDTGEYQPYSSPKSRKVTSISHPSFTPDTIAPRISFSKKSEKLTPDQLKQVRSQAAKKAAQSRKEREASDPEYAKRMHEIRVKAAKKAAISRKKHEENDPEFKKRMDEIRKKNLEKARKAKPKKPIKVPSEKPPKKPVDLPTIEPPESTQPQPEVPIEDLPKEYESVLANLRSTLQGAVNKNIANYLLDLLEDEIDLTSEEEVGARIAREREWVLELADGIAYGSGDSDELANKAYTLADIIQGGDVPGYMAESIEELAFEDIPYKRRK